MDLSGFLKKRKKKHEEARARQRTSWIISAKDMAKKRRKKKKLMPFIVRGTAVIKTRRSFRAMNRRNKRVANV